MVVPTHPCCSSCSCCRAAPTQSPGLFCFLRHPARKEAGSAPEDGTGHRSDSTRLLANVSLTQLYIPITHTLKRTKNFIKVSKAFLNLHISYTAYRTREELVTCTEPWDPRSGWMLAHQREVANVSLGLQAWVFFYRVNGLCLNPCVLPVSSFRYFPHRSWGDCVVFGFLPG